MSVALRLCCCVLLSPIAPLVAQNPDARVGSTPLKEVVARWLGSEQTDEALLETTVQAVLGKPEAGLRYIAAELAAAKTGPDAARTKGLRSLATHCSLEFLKRRTEDEMTFVGEYAPLQPLQPFVGELFFGLLLQTPDWYPDTHRVDLVPALRELQPTRPDPAIVDGVVALVKNEAIEPRDLRLALSCMLWQWGEKQYARTEIDRLVKESADGGPEDRIEALRQLTDLWYTLREYKQAVAIFHGLQAMADSAKLPLTPSDFYSAACSMSLAGMIGPGLDALTRCAELQASTEVDKSLKLQRKLFENDPEIAALRRDARFKAILTQAFPPDGAGR